MTPFAPNITHRTKIEYRGAGKLHTMTLRQLRSMSRSAAIAASHATIHDIFAAWNNVRLATDFAFISSVHCDPDSVDFTPSGSLPTGVTGACSLALFSPLATGASAEFFGQGIGSFTSIKCYGLLFNPMNPANPEANGVIGGGESTEVSDIVDILNAADLHVPNNTLAVWVNQATYDINDGWQKKIRTGG